MMTNGRLFCLLAVVAAAGLGRGAGAAQDAEVVVIPDNPSPPYVLDLRPGPVLEGGSLDGDDWVSSFGGMARLPNGSFLLWELLGHRLLVVGPDAADRRWIGREGEGPGEYQGILWARPHEDRLHVFDIFNLRRTVLDAESFEVLGSNPLGLYGQSCCGATVLDDSSYVISSASYVPEHAGYSLHRLDGDGTVALSFDKAPDGSPREEEVYRLLTEASRRGHVWSASLAEYRIDLWDAVEGRRRRSLVRETAEAPSLRTWALAEDPQGRLWTSLSVPIRPPPPDCPERELDVPLHVIRESCPPLTYTRIEVLDPSAGRVLAVWDAPPSLTADEAPSGITDDGTLYALGHDPFGFPIIRLWHANLRAR